MSKKLVTAPLAVTSEGTVLVNLTEFNGPRALRTLLKRAEQEPDAVFIGVELSEPEVRQALDRLMDPSVEAAAYIVGARLRRAKQ